MAFVRAALGLVLGAVGGALAALGLAVAAAEIFSISQMEGAYAMGVALFYMPLGAFAGAVVGAIVAMRGNRPKVHPGG